MAAREDEAHIIALHRNAQRLLKPVKVVNPYAEALTFRDDQTRTRRDHRKYLGLIRAIALLHQHQRPVKELRRPDGSSVPYIEATLADIAATNRLAHAILGHTLDELPPQTRRLLTLLRQMVTERAERDAITPKDIRFSRRELRDYTGMGDTQAKVHLGRLVELEYVFPCRLRHGDESRQLYELAWSGEGMDGEAFVMGLIDPAQLTAVDGYDRQRSGVDGDRSAPGRVEVGGVSAAGRGAENPVRTLQEKALREVICEPAENARPGHEDMPVAVVPPRTRPHEVALAG